MLLICANIIEHNAASRINFTLYHDDEEWISWNVENVGNGWESWILRKIFVYKILELCIVERVI